MNSGKVSENVLKHSILHQIHTRREEVLNGAGLGEDCAIFDMSAFGSAVLASCVRESAVAPAEDAGLGQVLTQSMPHLLQKGINNLAAVGAVPFAAMITLLLPVTAEHEDVRRLMAEAEEACSGFSVQIAGGQTLVTEGVSLPYGVVTCYGRAHRENRPSLKRAAPGQDVVLSKWVGLEGTALLARRRRQEIAAKYPPYLAEEAGSFDRYLSVVPEAATAMKSGVCAMHDVSEGGIFGALWELAEGAGVGLDIDLKKIPLRQETVEVCECCGVNPYELLSGGSLLMTAEDGNLLAEALRAEGIPAAVIGRTTKGRERIIRNEEEARYLERRGQDALYKI